jgi:hypothetical protein
MHKCDLHRGFRSLEKLILAAWVQEEKGALTSDNECMFSLCDRADSAAFHITMQLAYFTRRKFAGAAQLAARYPLLPAAALRVIFI